MNVVERTPPPTTRPVAAPPEAAAAEPTPARGSKLRPLASLLPYVRRYRARTAATAIITLK